jgi:hypothetical protein
LRELDHLFFFFFLRKKKKKKSLNKGVARDGIKEQADGRARKVKRGKEEKRRREQRNL